MTQSNNPSDTHNMRTGLRSSSYFVVRYSLEFVVVVLGITVSYWLNEWSIGKQELGHQVKDAQDLLQDLESDSGRLAVVFKTVLIGKNRTSRLLHNHEHFQEGGCTYAEFADSLIAIGYPYGNLTFFMNDGTYKTLLNNGRLQNFPSEVEDAIKKYYEYVGKRVEDNNTILDKVCLDYYMMDHPLYLLNGENTRRGLIPDSLWESRAQSFLHKPDVPALYESTKFYLRTLGVRNEIYRHELLLEEYTSIRDEVDSTLRAFLATHHDLHH